jgi:predicted O-methyltransferase YrrM
MNRLRHRGKILFWSIAWKIKRFRTVEDLVAGHFERWSQPDHQNRLGLFLALNSLSRKPAVIVETGTSASGTDSSRLFDAYVKNFGGNFYTVDIDSYPSKRLKFAKSKTTHFYVMDSVKFLLNFSEITTEKSVDLIYLDSWDVDWSNPVESAEHGEKELIAIRPLLQTGTIVVIDDTPADMNWIPVSDRGVAREFEKEFGVLPGKGAFYSRALKGVDFVALHHDYNLVLRVK